MGNYEKALAGLNTAQMQAVTTIEGPVLVIAGPGTGKTQLLATRIAHILATTDTLPENILCLTFTDSAAHNMRERLSSMIGQAAYKITISTYHAFGSDLIKRFRDYFAADGDLEPIDDLGIDRVFREIISGLAYDNPLKYSDQYLNDIKSFVSDAKRALLSPGDLRTLAAQNQAFIDAVTPAVSQALQGFTRMGGNSVAKFQTLADNLPPLPELTANQEGGHLPLSHMFAVSLHNALAQVAESGKTTELTKWKNTWLSKDAQGNFVPDGSKTNQKLLALADVYEKYLAALAEQHLFDYDDMILRAVHALEHNTDLKFTLQEQYLYILLDEFQDTNGAQLRLVELLTDNPVLEGRPNVLAVGDDDQAIYAFQGANYSHMLQFQRMYRDVLLVPLTQNYRSHADILHLAQGVASQIDERLHHHFKGIQKKLIASNPALPQTAIIERYEAASEASQFAWVARSIHNLIAKGAQPHAIAVLAPQHKYLEPLVPYLQELDIPIKYDKRENVLDDPAINQLLRMGELVTSLAAGQFETANMLWTEVLSFDFWQLPTSLIWQLSWQAADDGQNWAESLLQNETCKPIALFFMRLSQLAQTETLETMCDYIAGVTPLDLQEPGFKSYTSPFYAHYFGKNSGDMLQNMGTFWDLLSNLTVLRSRLRDYNRGSETPLVLADLLHFAHAHRAANIKILNTSPYQNSDDAVQLMTAFKAKGMEFDAVFLLAVNDEAWGDAARNQTSRLSIPPNLNYIRYAGATPDERLRLFYVAITRAQTQLFLVNYTRNFSGKTFNRLRYLEETSQDGRIMSPLLPGGEQTVRAIAPDAASEKQRANELSAFWQQRHQLAFSQEHLRALLRGRLQSFQLSPTHVNAFIDLEHAGPLPFFMSTILRFPKAPNAGGQFGNAVHETLEWLHTQNKQQGSVPDISATLAHFERRLKAKKLSVQDTVQMQPRGEAIFRAYLQQRLHTISAQNECERNFRFEGVCIGPAHMAGKIDKLIIDKRARAITIVDYKTGKNRERWDSSVTLHKYRQQLYLYKALVERSARFKGYAVTDAYLEFVEPNEDGNITELHLAFNQDEYSHICKLAEAVWNAVQTIHLPDISAYSTDMKSIQLFENDLIEQYANTAARSSAKTDAQTALL